MLLIMVVETKNKEGSDYYYLKSIIDYYYQVRCSGISIKYIFMNGKGNYERINNKIKLLIKQYSGKTKVIYFFDVDYQDLKYDQTQLNININNYCINNKYEAVWFNRTIEEVLIGKIIIKDKTKIAKDFFYNDRINNLDKNSLIIDKYELITIKKSNILNILDKYLKRNIEV